MRSGTDTDLHGREVAGPRPKANPRISGPRWFRTIGSGKPPFEWEHFGVVRGDIVERHGVVVSYALMHRESEDVWVGWWPDHVIVAMELESQHRSIWSADADGNLGSMRLASAGPDTQSIYDDAFTVDGSLIGGIGSVFRPAPRTAASSSGRRSSPRPSTRATSPVGGPRSAPS